MWSSLSAWQPLIFLRRVLRLAVSKTRGTFRGRVQDALFVILAVVVTLFIRGATQQHGAHRALVDTAWFVLVSGLYVLLTFLWMLRRAYQGVRNQWQPLTTGEPQVPALGLLPSDHQTIYGLKCVVHTQDGQTLEKTADYPNGTRITPSGFTSYPYPSAFPQDESKGLHGDHTYDWFIREKPAGQWARVIRAAPFRYDPLAPRPD